MIHASKILYVLGVKEVYKNEHSEVEVDFTLAEQLVLNYLRGW